MLRRKIDPDSVHHWARGVHRHHPAACGYRRIRADVAVARLLRRHEQDLQVTKGETDESARSCCFCRRRESDDVVVCTGNHCFPADRSGEGKFVDHRRPGLRSWPPADSARMSTDQLWLQEQEEEEEEEVVASVSNQTVETRKAPGNRGFLLSGWSLARSAAAPSPTLPRKR